MKSYPNYHCAKKLNVIFRIVPALDFSISVEKYIFNKEKKVHNSVYKILSMDLEIYCLGSRAFFSSFDDAD